MLILIIGGVVIFVTGFVLGVYHGLDIAKKYSDALMEELINVYAKLNTMPEREKRDKKVAR